MHAKRSKYARIEFVVTTERPLPVGEQVFIAGGLPELGDWKAAGLPLTRVEDSKWTGMLELPRNTRFEYKITRGSWDTEEQQEGEGPPPNRRLSARQDEVVTLQVRDWVDSRPSASASA